MTLDAEKKPDNILSPPQELDRGAAALEDLFLIGSTKSNVYTIYKDDAGKFITVQFRSLQPTEIIAVSDLAELHVSEIGKYITEQLETLARAIMYVNGMPLILTSQEREAYFEAHKRQASPLEMARIILLEKIKSPHILDAMFDAYREFVKDIQTTFDDIKKKLEIPTSSNLTSSS